MRKPTITLLLLCLLVSFTATAQDYRVAVFDPAGDATSSIKEIVREEISATLVGVKGYAVLERSLINKVLEENKFQASGLVDDSQVSAWAQATSWLQASPQWAETTTSPAK